MNVNDSQYSMKKEDHNVIDKTFGINSDDVQGFLQAGIYPYVRSQGIENELGPIIGQSLKQEIELHRVGLEARKANEKNLLEIGELLVKIIKMSKSKVAQIKKILSKGSINLNVFSDDQIHSNFLFEIEILKEQRCYLQSSLDSFKDKFWRNDRSLDCFKSKKSGEEYFSKTKDEVLNVLSSIDIVNTEVERFKEIHYMKLFIQRIMKNRPTLRDMIYNNVTIMIEVADIIELRIFSGRHREAGLGQNHFIPEELNNDLYSRQLVLQINGFITTAFWYTRLSFEYMTIEEEIENNKIVSATILFARILKIYTREVAICWGMKEELKTFAQDLVRMVSQKNHVEVGDSNFMETVDGMNENRFELSPLYKLIGVSLMDIHHDEFKDADGNIEESSESISQVM